MFIFHTIFLCESDIQTFRFTRYPVEEGGLIIHALCIFDEHIFEREWNDTTDSARLLNNKSVWSQSFGCVPQHCGYRDGLCVFVQSNKASCCGVCFAKYASPWISNTAATRCDSTLRMMCEEYYNVKRNLVEVLETRVHINQMVVSVLVEVDRNFINIISDLFWLSTNFMLADYICLIWFDSLT